MSVVARFIGLVRQLLWAVLDLAERAAAAFSWVADRSLNPDSRSGRAAPIHVAGWTLMNAVAFAAVAFPVPPSYAPPAALSAGIVMLGVLTNLLFVSAALFKLREDNDVVNGLVLETTRRFANYAAASSPFVVVNSIFFLILFLAASLQMVDSWFPSAFSTKTIDLQFPAYLVATLKALPGSGLVLGTLASYGFPLASFEFGNVAGNVAEHVILFISSFFLVGLITLWLRQIRDTDRLIEQYLDAAPSDRIYLHRRIHLSPRMIRPGILRAAVTPRASSKQSRAIEVAVQLKILEFPREFCARLRDQRSKATKRRGLEGALHIVEGSGAAFDSTTALEALPAAIAALGRTLPRSELNLALSRLVVALALRTSNISSLPPEAISVLVARMVDLATRASQKDTALQIASLQVALRCELTEIITAFISKLNSYPKAVAADGTDLIRQRIAGEFRSSAISKAIADPLKRILDADLSEELRSQVKQLQAIVEERNKPPLSLASRVLDWIPESVKAGAANSKALTPTSRFNSRDAA